MVWCDGVVVEVGKESCWKVEADGGDVPAVALSFQATRTSTPASPATFADYAVTLVVMSS